MSEPATLTVENNTSDQLHYLAAGQAEVEKQGQRFMIKALWFVGDVAFMTDGTPSGTVVAQPGGKVLSWETAELKAVGSKRMRFHLALNSLISKDLAGKVAASAAIKQA
ncbi:MAG: cyclic nucleotide-binding domain-containing protein [Rhodobacteraceae bacterium]|nr:cyclic nucleotide-binding domain-containing protein [Paracoccaceae bacterium]